MMTPYLTVSHLSKRYNDKFVLEDLSFEVSQGERIALFAPSGSGKTTLIHILAGLESFNSGCFHFSSQKPTVIFQDLRLLSFLTVEENIMLPFKIQSKPVTESIRQSYRQWLEICRLEECADQYPYQLSGGMKQKTALIRGFLGNPDFILMDEPFQSIDPASKQTIMKHILDSYPSTTMLFVTHQADEIPVMAQSVLCTQAHWLKQVVNLPVNVFQNWQSKFSSSFEQLLTNRTEYCTVL